MCIQENCYKLVISWWTFTIFIKDNWKIFNLFVIKYNLWSYASYGHWMIGNSLKIHWISIPFFWFKWRAKCNLHNKYSTNKQVCKHMSAYASLVQNSEQIFTCIMLRVRHLTTSKLTGNINNTSNLADDSSSG